MVSNEIETSSHPKKPFQTSSSLSPNVSSSSRNSSNRSAPTPVSEAAVQRMLSSATSEMKLAIVEELKAIMKADGLKKTVKDRAAGSVVSSSRTSVNNLPFSSTPSNIRLISSTPANILPISFTPARPAPDPIPKAIKKTHSFFYAFITVAILVLKRTDQPGADEKNYQSLLNYKRIGAIGVLNALFFDLLLVFLGLAYGGSQVVAQQLRINGNLLADIVSIYVGVGLVSGLMFGVSIFCGFFVAMLLLFVFMPFLHLKVFR